MTTPRILVLTNGPLARNPRVLQEATALGAAGHEVTVLGVRNHRPSVALDAALVARAACFRYCERRRKHGRTEVKEREHVDIVELDAVR